MSIVRSGKRRCWVLSFVFLVASAVGGFGFGSALER